jgi:hypothetical protein
MTSQERAFHEFAQFATSLKVTKRASLNPCILLLYVALVRFIRPKSCIRLA